MNDKQPIPFPNTAQLEAAAEILKPDEAKQTNAGTPLSEHLTPQTPINVEQAKQLFGMLNGTLGNHLRELLKICPMIQAVGDWGGRAEAGEFGENPTLTPEKMKELVAAGTPNPVATVLSVLGAIVSHATGGATRVGYKSDGGPTAQITINIEFPQKKGA